MASNSNSVIDVEMQDYYCGSPSEIPSYLPRYFYGSNDDHMPPTPVHDLSTLSQLSEANFAPPPSVESTPPRPFSSTANLENSKINFSLQFSLSALSDPSDNLA